MTKNWGIKLNELIEWYLGPRSRINGTELPGFTVWQAGEGPGSNYSNNCQSSIAAF